jgi:hypothetical protein
MVLIMRILKVSFALLLSLSLVMPSVLPMSTALAGLPALQLLSSTDPVKAHPLLLQMASEKPNQRGSVIVQKAGLTTQPEELVKRMGGHISKNLDIINAFAGEMTAAAAPTAGCQPRGALESVQGANNITSFLC